MDLRKSEALARLVAVAPLGASDDYFAILGRPLLLGGWRSFDQGAVLAFAAPWLISGMPLRPLELGIGGRDSRPSSRHLIEYGNARLSRSLPADTRGSKVELCGPASQ